MVVVSWFVREVGGGRVFTFLMGWMGRLKVWGVVVERGLRRRMGRLGRLRVGDVVVEGRLRRRSRGRAKSGA